MAKLSAPQVKSALAEIPEWKKSGAAIRRTYEFDDFAGAMKFAIAAAKRAEKAQHHPDIEISWNKVTLVLTTHDEGGLTKKDFEMAKRFDQL